MVTQIMQHIHNKVNADVCQTLIKKLHKIVKKIHITDFCNDLSIMQKYIDELSLKQYNFLVWFHNNRYR